MKSHTVHYAQVTSTIISIISRLPLNGIHSSVLINGFAQMELQTCTVNCVFVATLIVLLIIEMEIRCVWGVKVLM